MGRLPVRGGFRDRDEGLTQWVAHRKLRQMAEREGFGTLRRFWNPQPTDSTLPHVPYVLFVPTTIARYCTPVG